MNIVKVLEEYAEDMESIQTFCDELYLRNFADNFSEVRKLYARMKSKVHPITDEELEYVLTTFPLELFMAAENLNKFRLNFEVVKLKNRETIETIRKTALADASANGLNKSQTTDYVNHAIAENMVEYEVLSSAYSSVITRVENEQTFSKELIMGAKKIWDSRRSSETSNPVSPVIAEELPEYTKAGK